MWKGIKKVFNFISSVVLYSIFVLLIIIGLMVGAYFVDHYISLKTGHERAPLFGAYVIISRSMEPSIHVYDAVITMRVNPDSIEKNDVITFISNDPNHTGITITHRVLGIQKNQNGSYAYRTKGDHNNVEDRTLVSYDNVLGKVMLRIPSIGKIQKILLTNYGWLWLIVIPCLFIIVSDIIKLIKVIITGEESTSKEKQISSDIKNRKKNSSSKKKGKRI